MAFFLSRGPFTLLSPLSPLGPAPLAQPRALLGPASPAGPAPLLPGATAARLGRSAQRAAPAQPARLLRSQPLPAGPAGQLFPPPSSRATRNRSGGRAATAPAPCASWARRPLLGLFLRAEPLPRVPLSLPAPISPSLTHRRPQQPSLRGRRIPPSASARAAVPELSPPPFFPAVRTPSSPLSPRAVICEFRGP